MQFWFISVLCILHCSLLACWCWTSYSLLVLLLWKADMQPEPEIVIFQSLTAAPLSNIHSSRQLLSFQEWSLKSHSSSGSNSQQAKMPTSNAGQETVLWLVLPSMQEEVTQPSPRCRINVSTWNKQKKAFCSPVSSYFLGTNCSVYAIWPMNVDWAGAWLRGSKTQENWCILLLTKALWFLNLCSSDRLIASDVLITF